MGLPILGDDIVLVNRTTKPITFKADGRDHVLKPGDNYGFNTGHAEFAYKQNPVPGTADYGTLDFVSKIGIARPTGEILYDTSPLTDEFLASMGDKEYFDLATLPVTARAGRTREQGKYVPTAREASARGTVNASAVSDQ